MTLFLLALLAARLCLPVAQAAAQAPDAAAVHRAVARVQLLLKKNLRYLVRAGNAELVTKQEASRQELVAATAAAVASLHPQVVAPGQVPLTAIAVRLGTALLAEQQTSYRLVNKLLTSRDQSLGASQAYWEAAAAAHLRAANLTDSLELARRAFAEDEGVRQDITREVQLWTRATRQVAELYGYYPQVLLPCVRMRESIKQLLNKLQAHDGAGFVEARQQLAVEAGFAAAELAAVTDFMNLDVAFRDAGRAFVAQQLDACTGSLARAADLMLTQRSRELTNEEAQGINGLLNEYIRQTQAKDVALEKAGETFLRRNSPNFNADNAR